MQEDTIAAISTPVGEGGIGIIRVSGPAAQRIARDIFITRHKRPLSRLPDRRALLGFIHDPSSHAIIDQALLTFMRGPHSYTGDDVVEINCHGSPASLKAILGLTLRCGARLAEPGEFTKRAFLNGKMDLAQAEAVLDIVKSRTEASLRTAMRQLQGGLSREINSLMDGIIKVAAPLEASLDFPEEDLSIPSYGALASELSRSVEAMDRLVETYGKGRIYREGVSAVLVGRPNVGKSSIFNALLQEERAIVTPVPGTTRDSIEEGLNIGGILFRLTDTAGIRKAEDQIEILSLNRTWCILESSDVILLIVEAHVGLTDGDMELIHHLMGKDLLLVLNKTDLGENLNAEPLSGLVGDGRIVRCSAVTPGGVDQLRSALYQLFASEEAGAGESPVVTSARHVEALAAAREGVSRAIRGMGEGLSPELIMVDLNDALERLGQIVGRGFSSEILAQIFSRFCIGK